METQELINERNELFESFKSEFSKQWRKSLIISILICLLIGLIIYSAVSGDMNWLTCTIVCVCLLIALCHDLLRIHKLTNADSAQDFVTLYDKHRKIHKWLFLIILPLAIFVIYTDPFIHNKIDNIIWLAALLLISFIANPPFHDPYKNSIDRLRELVQQP